MEQQTSIAVIMSVYNSDKVEDFQLAVESILDQTIKCDLIIYQDGTVSSLLSEALERFSSIDSVTVYRSDINKGLASALNYLIEKALGAGYEYIARMDSDDISYPERMQKQLKYLQSNIDIDVLGTSCREFGASFALEEKHLPVTHEELLNFSITRCPFIHPTVMFRASVFENGHRYPVDTALTEDMALWFDLLNSGVKFGNIREVLLDYRLNENTIERRKGIAKAMSEVFLRFSNMKSLNKVTLKNSVLISGRIVFHLMPSFLVKLAYRKAR